MRYVVTGAAGFIGSHLAERLISDGHEVVAVDSFTGYYERARKERNAAGLNVLELDLAKDWLGDMLKNCDGVFHLAGQPGVRASWGQDFHLYLERNVLATQRVFEACHKRGIRVVYASSSSVYGNAETYPTSEDVTPRPISPYGITKLACEHLAYAIGLDAVGLRYFTVYGPRQRPDMAFQAMLEALDLGSQFHLFGDGYASRSFTYVDDAVQATIAAMERGTVREVYNIGGGEEATLNQVMMLVTRIAGRALNGKQHPAAVGDVRRTSASVLKAWAHLKWTPTTSLEDGLRAQWDALTACSSKRAA